MTKARFLFAAVLLAQGAAFASDPGLLGLVMPDAKVIAGVKVNQAKVSPIGQYVLSHMQPDTPEFQKFVQDTHFDPRTDLTEIVLASNANSNVASHWLVLARGRFDPTQIASAARQNGATASQFQGVGIFTGSAHANGATSSMAFLDSSSAVIGDSDSVKASIGRFRQQTAPAGQLVDRVNPLSAKYDFWFASLAPLSEFAALMPEPTVGQAMKGNMLHSIQQLSGGITFGPTIQVATELVARTDKDAGALVDVVRFLAGMITLNRDKNQIAGQVSTLVDTMQLSATGNVMSMSLSIPELLLEQLVEGMQASGPRGSKQLRR